MTTQLDRIIEAARALRPSAGAALAAGLDDYVGRHGAAWSDYEVQQAVLETVALGEGEDCTYDRPSVGVVYASWYHPRRVDDMMRILYPKFVSGRTEIEIVDVGCGTGSTAWAAVWLNQALIDTGRKPIPVKIIASDSSPFMVEVAEQLWSTLAESAFAEGHASVVLDMTHSHVPSKVKMWDPILTAGYLIDSSDRTQPAEVGLALNALAAQFGCYELLTTTSVRKSDDVLPKAIDAMVAEGWSRQVSDEVSEFLGPEPVSELLEFRDRFLSGRGLSDGLTHSVPKWSDGWTEFAQLRREMPSEPGEMMSLPLEEAGPRFDRVQRAAIDGRRTGPERIVGAAGSGKSLVLMRRVAETVQKSFRVDPDRHLTILVTCFNKQMVAVLADMLRGSIGVVAPRCEAESTGDEESDQTITIRDGDSTASVRLINLDKIPTRIMGMSYGSNPGRGGRVPGMYRVRRDLSTADQDRFAAYLDEEFLLDAINCVVVGQGATTWEEYADVARHGRPFTLARGGDARRIIWESITNYTSAAFAYRWWNLIATWKEELMTGQTIVDHPFDHVLVDEAQDFTEFQLRFMAALGGSLDDFVIAIDQAQSIRIGPAFRTPTFAGRRWASRHVLEGSYRLPVRIAEAARPLAEGIATMHSGSGRTPDTASPYGRKAGVLGFRPIVVATGDVSVVEDVLSVYLPRIDGGPRLTVLQENGSGLGTALRGSDSFGVDVETAWVEAIKGQERPAVLWRDGAIRPDDIGMAEIVYTVATRTTSLLVLVLEDDATLEAQALVGRFDPKRLLFWDAESKSKWAECQSLVGTDADPLSDIEFDEGYLMVDDEVEIDEDARSNAEILEILSSSNLPTTPESGLEIGDAVVYLAHETVWIRRSSGTRQFTPAVFDGALRAWLDLGRPRDAVELGRVGGERIRSLLRLFLAA